LALALVVATPVKAFLYGAAAADIASFVAVASVLAVVAPDTRG
jgi:hypothetical protein